MNQVAVWWIKRDARLADNGAVHEAARNEAFVLPVFCEEPSIRSAGDSSSMHAHAQWQAVSALQDELRRRGGDLHWATSEAVEAFERLHRIAPFQRLVSHEEIGNAATYQRDRAVAAWCRARSVEYVEVPQSSVKRGGVNRDRFQVLWKSRIEGAEPLPEIAVRQSPELLVLGCRPTTPSWPAAATNWQVVTEVAGQRTLRDFLDRRGLWYRGGISSPNTADSRLSVHLAWGTLSVRQVWYATQQRLSHLRADAPEGSDRWTKSLEAFTSRLHWRDHFTQRLESEPDLEFRSIHPAYRNVPYGDDPALLEAWCTGRTGVPLVDAVMRCLAATGFVNFRMRAMVVSYACHALHLSWQAIHPHLAGVFRDYDPGIHLSQLQMQAGVVGWNPIRVYNPTKQLADWDAAGRFTKRWVPELRDVPAERLLNLEAEPVPGYRPPVVPFVERTKEMKDWLYAIRQSQDPTMTAAVYARHGSRKPQRSAPARPKRLPKRDLQLRLFE